MNAASATIRPTAAQPSHPAAFVARFASAWNSRDPSAIAALLHPDVVLIQPLIRPLHGPAAGSRLMSELLELMPDLTITIHDSFAQGDRVLVDFSFNGSIGTHAVQLRMIDRIELAEGLIRSRLCFFDPSTVVLAIARQPRFWPRLARLLWRARPVPSRSERNSYRVATGHLPE